MAFGRQLAAIMFTDMVGYTRLMQTDEHLAMQLRDRHRDVLRKSVALHNGKIVQYFGDGTLVLFSSSIEALQCALSIQQALAKDPKVPLRIGIHSSDVVYNEEGIYGDGVNVASRIESFSVPGSVLFSGKVMDDVKNHKEFKTQSLGKFQLKNVDDPIGLFALCNTPLVVPNPKDLEGKGEVARKKIAVLPFINMSTDSDNEYFSDGITEEILNVLARIEELRVTARTSSFSFKGKNIAVQEIGKELNVQYVLEGSVRKSGNRVRITAQLISVSDGFHLWSENFTRDLEDIFVLQDEIASKISSKLAEKLVLTQRKVKKVANIEAYNLYLKGNFYWKRWSPEAVKKSIELYEQSIALDPESSLPYAGLAGAYVYLVITGNMAQNAYEKSLKAAHRAIELDDRDDRSLMAMGMIKFLFEKDDEAARDYFQKALAINPDNSEGHHYYAMYLSNKGQFEEALQEMERAHELDPLSLIILVSLGETTFFAGHHELAIHRYHQALELDPSFRQAWEGIGWVYSSLHKYEEALEAFRKYQSLTGSKNKGLSGLGFVLGRMGRKKEALEILELLRERQKEEPDIVLDMDMTMVYVGLEDWENTYLHMENSLKKKMGGLFLNSHPMWEEVRNKPRFKELMRKYSF